MDPDFIRRAGQPAKRLAWADPGLRGMTFLRIDRPWRPAPRSGVASDKQKHGLCAASHCQFIAIGNTQRALARQCFVRRCVENLAATGLAVGTTEKPANHS